MEQGDPEELVRHARAHLQAAIACLDRLGRHQSAAHADLALHLLEAERERGSLSEERV